jgi:hypothetical protein
MNAVTKSEDATLSIMTIEEGLAELCKFGNAGLSRLDNGGWHCVLKMFVSGAAQVKRQAAKARRKK